MPKGVPCLSGACPLHMPLDGCTFRRRQAIGLMTLAELEQHCVVLKRERRLERESRLTKWARRQMRMGE